MSSDEEVVEEAGGDSREEDQEGVAPLVSGGSAGNGDDDGGGSIQVFLRCKPIKTKNNWVNTDIDNARLEFNIPVVKNIGTENERLRNAKFQFHGILDQQCSQEDVFELVAKDCVQSVVAGFNSTIFAYGQTGSGKTYSITGGTRAYEERGIIPRVLSDLFERIEQQSAAKYLVYLSFLEIYNDRGRDLLNSDMLEAQAQAKRNPGAVSAAGHAAAARKILVVESETGGIECKNLSTHLVTTVEDALNLLFIGDTNREMGATEMNVQSSRSHCIFMLSVESRQPGSEVIRRAKLNLVDLAGSERVSKSKSKGERFTEAKHINLSLHYLQMVIVKLQERAQGKDVPHIPYRNSMMTSVLRDSLGGNCKTRMLATVTLHPKHIEETLSTCKFAQYVAMVKNSARVNEETDPALLLQRQQQENAALREELALLKEGADVEETLSTSWLRRTKDKVLDFMRDANPDAMLNLGKITAIRVRAAFRMFREVCSDIIQEAKSNVAGQSDQGGHGKESCSQCPRHKKTIRKMEQEIEALTEAAKNYYSGNNSSVAAAPVQGATKSYTGNRHTHQTVDAATKHNKLRKASRRGKKMRQRSPSDASIEGCSSEGEDSNSGSDGNDDDDDGDDDAEEGPLVSLDGVELDKDAQPPPIEEILASKPDAFRWFCSAHLHTPALKMNKKSLQKKVDHAKTLAQRINAARSKIANLTQDVQRLRLAAKAQRISSSESKTRRAESKNEDLDDDDCTEDSESSGHVPSEEETAALRQIAAAKREYKEGLVVLKKVKKEVGTIQELISTNTRSIKEQFKVWYGRVLQLGADNKNGARDDEAVTHGASSKKKSSANDGSSLRESTSSARNAGEGKRAEARVTAGNDHDVDALFLAARSELLARKNGK